MTEPHDSGEGTLDQSELESVSGGANESAAQDSATSNPPPPEPLLDQSKWEKPIQLEIRF